MTDELKLTENQKELFEALASRLQQETALEFIRNGYGNKTKSYESACKTLGKKPSKHPVASASEILSNPNITAFIESVKVVVSNSVNIDAAWVLMSAKKVFDRCMQFEKVVDKQGGAVLDADGRPIYKFEPASANKSLEIIGKHVKVRAFEREEAKEDKDTTIILNFTDAVKPSED